MGIIGGMSFLLRGFLIGLSIAAPVGPIGKLCIRRTLAGGRLAGLVSGLGAATADAFYGSVAGFGLAFISTFLVSHQLWLRLIGGSFLMALGFRTLFARPGERSSPEVHSPSPRWTGLLGAYASTLFLTLTNPLTILSFAAVFAGLGLAAQRGSYASAGLLVLGVFGGSALWWLLLSGGVSLFRRHFNLKALQVVNWLSGAVIIVFGVAALVGLG